jgi:hypothetical protein
MKRLLFLFFSDMDAQLRAALGSCHLFFEPVRRQISLLSVTFRYIFIDLLLSTNSRPPSEWELQCLKKAISLHFRRRHVKLRNSS